jgi:hypothetical protein
MRGFFQAISPSLAYEQSFHHAVSDSREPTEADQVTARHNLVWRAIVARTHWMGSALSHASAVHAPYGKGNTAPE